MRTCVTLIATLLVASNAAAAPGKDTAFDETIDDTFDFGDASETKGAAVWKDPKMTFERDIDARAKTWFEDEGFVDCIERDLEQFMEDLRGGFVPPPHPMLPYCDEIDALPRHRITGSAAFPWVFLATARPHGNVHFFLELDNDDPALVLDLPWELTATQSSRFIEIRGDVPGDAQTSIFVVDTSYGTYSLTLPVEAGIQRCDRWGLDLVFRHDDPESIELCGSGPEGILTLEYIPDDPSQPAPDGVVVDWPTAPGDRVGFSGSLAPSSRTRDGEVVLYDGAGRELARERLRVEASPFPIPGSNGAAFHRRSPQVWKSDQVPEATKHRDVSFWLPRLGGGDGTYAWSAPYGLPDGLALEHVGADWRIGGVLTSDAFSSIRNIDLLFASGSHEFGHYLMSLDVQPVALSEFSVLTQNSLMRPPNPTACANGAAIGVGALGGAVLGAVTGGLAPAVGAAAGAVAGLTIGQFYYDERAGNTSDDNAERTQRLVDLVHDKRTRRSADPSAAPFDLVAVQEMFDFTARDELVWDTEDLFAHFLGPDPTACEINSGLDLLVRDDWVVDWHVSQAFEAEAEVPQPDAFANKGFTLTKIRVDPGFADDYFYVVNIHTDAHPTDSTIRFAQLSEMADVVDDETDPEHPVLFLGDFNVKGETLQYQQLLALLDDPIDLYRRKYDPYAFHTFPAFEESGLTSDGRRNAYASGWFPGELPKRLDYALLRQGTEWKLLMEDIVMVDDPMDTDLYRDQGWDIDRTACLTDAPPYGLDPNGNVLNCSYLSDHFGLRVDLRLVWD